MQKITSLLLVIIAGNIFAGKKDRVMQGSMHAVINKYNLVMPKEKDKKKKASSYDVDMVAWQTLQRKYKKLQQEHDQILHKHDQVLRLLQEYERIDEKQEQSSSSEASPSSAIAISPTNMGDEQQLSSPQEMYLATPESKIIQSPIKSLQYNSHYHEWPASGNVLGRSPGLPIDCKISDDYDVYYHPAHAYCP